MSGGSSKRYPPELRERAVRMVAEISDQHDSEWAAICEVARLLGVGTAETAQVGAQGPGRCRPTARDHDRRISRAEAPAAGERRVAKGLTDFEDSVGFLRVNVILSWPGGVRSFLR